MKEKKSQDEREKPISVFHENFFYSFFFNERRQSLLLNSKNTQFQVNGSCQQNF